MKRSISKRLLALLLCMAMVLPYLDALPLKVWAESTQSSTDPEAPLAVIGAASDFQYLGVDTDGDDVKDPVYNGVTYEDIYAANGALLKDILNQMKKDHSSLNAYFLCGDYDGDEYVYATSSAGIAAAYGVLNEVYGLTYDQIQFVQGNHDPADAENLDATGAYDSTYYGVYQINEDNFPWGSNEETTADAAAGLKSYLDAKVAAGYTKPIFVISHLPLHHSHRMNGTRTDNSYARYLVDVLNEAGEAGLNIVYMFGHNHSGTYDCYLGRDCIYLLPGTVMPVTDPEVGTVDAYDEVSLSFTYMNPGYVGYAGDVLTSTVFEIYEDRMEISRYSASGTVPLKKAGYSSGNASETWSANTTVLESPYTQSLSEITLSVESSTLGSTLAPEDTAQIKIGVQSESACTVTWEIIGDELVSLTPDASDPTLVNITGVTYGTTTVKVTVRNAADATAVPATLRFDVTVAPDGAVKFNDAEDSNLYQLVTDWSTLSVDKKYMLLNRDTAGFASAMGGPSDATGRDQIDPATVQTKPTVFTLTGQTGLYTAPINGQDVWELKTHSGDLLYHLRQVSSAASYVAAANAVDAELSYGYACGIRFASGYMSGGSARFAVDAENKALILNSYYKSSALTTPADAYGLYYDSTAGYFELSTGGSPVSIYEWTGLAGPEIWMWLTSDSGNIVLNGNEVTGAKVAIMVDGVVSEIPITGDMLTGAYPAVPGTRTCSVSCYGKLISEQFRISVTNEEGVIITPVTLIENKGNLYRLITATDLTDGGQYMLVPGTAAGDSFAVGAVKNADDSYSISAVPTTIYASNDGTLYVQPQDDSVLWNATASDLTDANNVTHTKDAHFFVSNELYGAYLNGTRSGSVADVELLELEDMPETSLGWRLSGTYARKFTTNGSTYVALKLVNGTFIGSVIANTSAYAQAYVKDPDATLDRVIAYVKDQTGEITASLSTSQTTGGTVTVSTYYTDGTFKQEEIPITVDMLDVSITDLMMPGSYPCKVTYNGYVVCEDYLLTVNAAEGETVADTPVIYAAEGGIYKYVTAMATGVEYVIVDTKVAGTANMLTVAESDGSYTYPAAKTQVFTVEGLTESDGTASLFVVPRNDSSIFKSEVGATENYYLYNPLHQRYFYTDSSYAFYMSQQAPDGSLNWRYSDTQDALCSSASSIPLSDGDIFYILDDGSVPSAQRSQLYIRDSSIKTMVAYVDSLTGAYTVGSDANEVGGNVVIKSILSDGTVETVQFPITLDMLDVPATTLLTPGEHTCKVVYNGAVISENYKLTVTSTAGTPAADPVAVSDSWQFFKLVDLEAGFVANSTYVLADTNAAEAANVLTAVAADGGYSVAAATSAVLDYDGTKYIAVKDSSWLWDTADHFGSRSIQHQASGKYLGATNAYALVLRDAPSASYAWRYTSSLNVASTTASIPEGSETAVSADIVFKDGQFGLAVRNSANTTQHVYAYQKNTDIQGLVMYTDSLKGQCSSGSADTTAVGGNIIVNTLIGGTTDQYQVPITLDMLDLTAQQRLIPGTYTCSLTYNGQVLTENYKITIAAPEGENPAVTDPVVLVAEGADVFRCYSSGYEWVDSNEFVFVDTAVAGEGTVVGVTSDGKGGYFISTHEGETFTVGEDGHVYVVARSQDQIWTSRKTIETTNGPVSTTNSPRFYLENNAYGGYLFVTADYELLLADADTAATITNGWRVSTDASLVTGSQTASNPYADLVPRGPEFVARFRQVTSGNAVDTTRIYVRNTDIVTSLAYLDGKTGASSVNSIDSYACGGNVMVKTIMADSTVVTDKVPITLDMLQLSYAQKRTAGTHTCQVVYRGQVLCEDYVLTVANDTSAPQADEAVLMFENNGTLFKRVIKLTATKKYVFVDSMEVGSASAMTLGADGTFPATDATVFTVDGGTDLYVVARDSSWIWNAEPMYNTAGTVVTTIYSPVTGQYLHVNAQGQLLMVDRADAIPTQSGWHYAGSTRVLGNGSAGETPYITVKNMKGVFQAVDRNTDPTDTYGAYLYEQEDTLEGQVAYVTALKSTCSIGSSYSKALDGSVVVKTYHTDGSVTTQEIPITLSMLRGIEPLDLYVAGEHTCSVVYNGQIITDAYQLTITGEGSTAATTPVELADEDDLIFIRTTRLEDGKRYVFVDTKTTGKGRVLAVCLENGEYVLTAPQTMVASDGINELVIARSQSWIWDATAINTERAMLYNGNAQQQLIPAEDLTLVLGAHTDTTYGWRVSGTENFGCSGGLYYTDVISGDDGFYMRSRDENDDTGYTYAYVQDTSVSLVLGYVDSLTGTVQVGQTGKVLPGGNLVVKTHYKDGSAGETNIPITLDMLGLTPTQLNTPGTYTCTISYDGTTITDEYVLTVTGEAAEGMVEFPGNDRDISGYLAVLDSFISDPLPAGSGGRIPTGSTVKLYTYYADGTVELTQEDVTVDMLSVTSEQMTTAGNYTGLTLTYNKLPITDQYTLRLVEQIADDYPDFPNEGSVKVDKQMDTTKFNYLQTGSAQIDLSVAGIPTTSKANVVVILDASSSMLACTHGVYWGKLERSEAAIIDKAFAMEETLTEEEIAFLQSLDWPGYGEDAVVKNQARMQAVIDGTISATELVNLKKNMRMYGLCYDADTDTYKWVGDEAGQCNRRAKVTQDALAELLEFLQQDMAGYDMDIDVAVAYFNQLYATDENLTFLNNQDTLTLTPRSEAELMLPFTNSKEVVVEDVLARYETISGTNYDRGMEWIYRLLSEKQTLDYQEYLAGDTSQPYRARQDFVLFMSDGEPGQYNYMLTNNAGEFSAFYSGKISEDKMDQYVSAENLPAFKEMYHPEGKLWLAEAIKGSKTEYYKVIDPSMPETNYVNHVTGLDATMMTVTLNSFNSVMYRIASSAEYYIPTETADDIQQAFSVFGNLVTSGSGAYFKDEMGPEFDLQMANTIIPSNIKDLYHSGSGSWDTYSGTKTTRTVYFDNYGSSWGTANIYTWDASGNPTTGTWPGTAMTHLGNGVFTYEVPENAVNIIFNDGSSQTADLKLQTNGTYLYDLSATKWVSYDTRTVYFDATGCSWNSICAYTWGGSGISTTGTWPGAEMIHLGGSIYSCQIPADAENIIFNNGNNGSQTADLTPPTDGKDLYRYSSGSWDTYATRTVYFNNASTNWSNVYAYTWDESGAFTTSAWPGMGMTHLGGGIWSCQVPADAQIIQFNDGTDANKIDQLTLPETEIQLNSAITVSTYELYKYSEHLENPEAVTMDMVGKRKGTDPTVLEQVTFSDDGTEAYSNLIDGGKTNILIDGVICAKYFRYNTDTGSAAMIDTDGDGTAETLLESETFYWAVGSIPEDELVLTYNVYLTGTLEGTRTKGSYPTNEYASLYYDNHLGNSCQLDTTSPMLPWNQAVVGYGFYLVDANGDPLVNEDQHITGSFEKAIRMTQPQYIDLLYNTADDVTPRALNASEVLPAGYSLYDPTAAYHVALYANGDGSWQVTGGQSKLTTYVTGYGGQPTTQISATAGMGDDADYASYATASTVVWFAVRADVNAVPDTVVIDYGLSVDIHVLGNDVVITNQNSTIAGIGAVRPAQDDSVDFTAALAEGFTGSYAGPFGSAQVLGDVVRYTPGSMQFTAEDTFSYAAKYNGEKNAGYYYASVTVIPATNIYFEDNFITFDDKWSQVGQTLTNTQDEDRVGSYNLPHLDANSIYGYDSAYANMTTWSMGSAMVARVSEDSPEAIATFTFTGTGFDVLSYCSSDTGAITVSIYEGDAIDSSKLVTTSMVDTYYGCTVSCYKVTFTYTNGKWERVEALIDRSEMGETEPQPTNPQEGDTYVAYLTRLTPSENGDEVLYQVPVIKHSGLPYGTYTVEVYVGWAWWLAQSRPNYAWDDFYLDAIRIYDPANDGADSTVVKDAYVSDNEGWPSYQELRNLLITMDTFDSLSAQDEVEGLVFIDGITAAGTASLNDYTHFGPNNELYLAPGQAVAFRLNVDATDENVAAIHLGLASVGGTAVTKVYNAALDHTTVSERRLTSGTQQYYDITDLDGQTVVIWNVGGEGDAILSVTDLKTTYKNQPKITDRTVLTVSRSTALLALTSMGADSTPVLTPKYPTLSFEGEVCYNVYFTADDLGSLEASDLGLAVFTEEDTDGTVDNAAYVMNGAVEANGMYAVSTRGIAAKNLGDKLYFKVFARCIDGSYVYSSLYSYSALQYAENVLSGSYTDTHKALVVAMLKYGAAAQTMFGHKADSLMNSGLTADQQALLSGYSTDSLNSVGTVEEAKAGSFASNGGFTAKYPTVCFEGVFSIHYYFTPEKAVGGDMTFYYWTEDTYNAATELTADNADGTYAMTATEGTYHGVSPELAAKELDKTIYVAAVYESEGVTYSTGVLAYSLAAYCLGQANSTDPATAALANAAAIYGCAAKTYFGS